LPGDVVQELSDCGIKLNRPTYAAAARALLAAIMELTAQHAE
jgi:hypothetical protein